MAKSTRPRVKVKCVADRYHENGQRIIEFTDDATGLGGLIALRRTYDNRLRVDVFRQDAGVYVFVAELEPAEA